MTPKRPRVRSNVTGGWTEALAVALRDIARRATDPVGGFVVLVRTVPADGTGKWLLGHSVDRRHFPALAPLLKQAAEVLDVEALAIAERENPVAGN